MIIGIDVGNTAIKLAVASQPDTIVERVANPNSINSLSRTLLEFARDEPVDVRIASVNRATTNSLISQTQTIAGQRVRFRQISCMDLSIPIATDAPEQVGIDRLVGAWGAARRYQLPLVVVDAGTTVTVDLVDAQGVYRGGAIIPGLEMQTRALATGTDALPQIDWQESCESVDNSSSHSTSRQSSWSQSVPAKNTIGAIRLGILSSVVGGIERLVRIYGSPKCVVVTGGDCQCIAKTLQSSAHLHFETHVHPHLVCRTLAALELK